MIGWVGSAVLRGLAMRGVRSLHYASDGASPAKVVYSAEGLHVHCSALLLLKQAASIAQSQAIWGAIKC